MAGPILHAACLLLRQVEFATAQGIYKIIHQDAATVCDYACQADCTSTLNLPGSVSYSRTSSRFQTVLWKRGLPRQQQLRCFS
jgi:hypothetical protein